MIRRLAFAVVIVLFVAQFSLSAPTQVIIIRHAEKPPTGDDLNAKGRMRAAALVPYFLEAPEVLEFKTPVAIYAQKSTDSHKSRRPVDTVWPTTRNLYPSSDGSESASAMRPSVR